MIPKTVVVIVGSTRYVMAMAMVLKACLLLLMRIPPKTSREKIVITGRVIASA